MACRRRPCLARPRLPQQMQKNRQKKYTQTQTTLGSSQVQTLSVDDPTFRCIGRWRHTSCDGVRQRELTKDELYSIYAITDINLGPPESTSPCTVLNSSKGLPRGGQATLTGLEEQTKDSDDHLG